MSNEPETKIETVETVETVETAKFFCPNCSESTGLCIIEINAKLNAPQSCPFGGGPARWEIYW